MNFNKAKEILAIHSGYCKNFNYSEYTTFVGVLRPYEGLENDYFHEIIEALLYLREHFKNKLIDKEIVSYIAEICSTCIFLALKEDSSIRKNNLMQNKDLKKLNNWIYIISETSIALIRKNKIEDIISYYLDYLKYNDYGENIEKLIPFFIELISNIDIEDTMDERLTLTLTLEVLAKIGPKAKKTLIILNEIQNKKKYKSFKSEIKFAIEKINI